jgi:large subunit ribosomal protein L20
MARAKRGFKRRRRVKKLLDRAEGYYLRRKNTYRRAIEQVQRSLAYAYRDRRVKKRDFRALWNTRIAAAGALNDISYSRFIGALTKGNVLLNRKMLSEIAIQDPAAFTKIVNEVRSLAPAH